MPEIACPVAEAAQSAPDAVALRTSARAWTYVEWHREIAGMAAVLRDSGVDTGDRVAILAPPGPSYVTLLLALWRLRAVACPVNMRWPMERVASVFRGSGGSPGDASKIVVQHFMCSDEFRADVSGRGFHAKCLPALSPPPGGRANLDKKSNALELDRPSTIYFTSGSSGLPKAVLHRLGNHYANALASNNNIPLTTGDAWLLSLPLYHVAGMGVLWRCITARATIALPDPGEDFSEAIDRYAVTHVSLVTTQLYRMLQSDTAIEILKRLKAILLGGSAVAPSLLDRVLQLGLPLYKTYGMTETASQITSTRPGDPPSAMYTSGRPICEDSVRIDEAGHIQVRGATRFDGYLVGDTIEQPFDAEGWFDTGDRGEWTSDGYLRVTGRADYMFISGGENVQPEDVERALCSVRGIEEALVVGVPDDELGQRAVAFVRGERTRDEIIRELRTALPGYMIPRTILAWPHHLVEAHAKVNRARFREHARAITAPDGSTSPGLPPE